LNRYQEALNNVKRVYVESDHYDEEDINLLQELVDKATPKKVCPKWRTGYDPKLYYPKSFHCPSCGRKLRIDQFYKWCPDCNQALEKWSDEDDK
jgi:uncharacterized protein with PIN domain